MEKKVLVDSDVMIDYFDRVNVRHQQTKTILENHIGTSNVVISAITKMELILGATSKEDLQRKIKKINSIFCLLINDEISLK